MLNLLSLLGLFALGGWGSGKFAGASLGYTLAASRSQAWRPGTAGTYFFITALQKLSKSNIFLLSSFLNKNSDFHEEEKTMAKLSLMDFSRLCGQDHAHISRLVKARRLNRVDGLLDTECQLNAIYLSLRFVDVQIGAEMGKRSRGWVLLSVSDGGRKIPIATWPEVEYTKTIRLSRLRHYTINDGDETATEAATSRILPLDYERD